MDTKLETTSNEIVATSAPATPPAPEKPKKTGAMTIVAVFFAILAITSIAFGVYGMFFSQPQGCTTECDTNDSTDTPTDSTSSSAPSVSEVERILKDKYNITQNSPAFGPSMLGIPLNDFISVFDDKVKLVHTIKMSDNFLSEPVDIELGLYARTIDYDKLNNRYKQLFGNDQEIAKEDVLDIKYYGIIDIKFSSEDNTVEITYADGLGGGTPSVRLNKIDSITGTDEKFSVVLLSTIVNTEVYNTCSQCTYVAISEPDQQNIRESLSSYTLNFIKEDGEYKLISIE